MKEPLQAAFICSQRDVVEVSPSPLGFFFLYCALYPAPLRASLNIFSLILFSVLNWDTFSLDVSTEAEEGVERDGGRMELVGQRAISSHLPECTEKKTG